MSPRIRISEETKQQLESVKRDDETFDELLDRIVVDRIDSDVAEFLGMAGSGRIDEHMQEVNEEFSASLEANAERE